MSTTRRLKILRFPCDNTMDEHIKKLLDKGYSHCAIAMDCGGPVGTTEYYKVLNELDPQRPVGCPYCGELCFGTGDCNCRDV
jgi:ribosomal protein L34E